MFEEFLRAFLLSPTLSHSAEDARIGMPGERVRGFAELMAAYPGGTFGNGVYRLHTQQSGTWADAIVHRAFPTRARYYCFAFDWLGRQFALHPTDRVKGEPGVARIDLLELRVQLMDQSFSGFHNSLLPADPESVIEAELFAAWANTHPGLLPLRPNQIVGYRIPLALGGEHELENLEVVDIQVEYALTGQIDEQTAGMPEGTAIEGVVLAEEE